jgi:hypothetical protein
VASVIVDGTDVVVHLSGLEKLAAFRGGRDFAAVRGRRPAVRLELEPPSPFSRVVVSVADPETTVARVRGVATGLRADG